ncbi:MAG: tyrosine-type recombinase/integrase [Bacteroidales bacterium]|nr:tyrosine-type recombinase/integrase [Bacteroidales bacterium]
MHKKRFLKYIEYQKKYSSHTVNSYATDLNNFYWFCIDNEFITSEDEIISDYKIIRKWIVFLSSQKLSAKSINRKLSTLRSFYNFLLRENLIDSNPILKITRLKTEKKLPEFISDKKMELLLDSPVFSDDFEGVRNHLIIEMLYGTGMRRAELINLSVKDIDLNKQNVKVTGKRNKQRIIPFPVNLSELINKYLMLRKEINTENEFLFLTKTGKKIYPNLVYRTVNKFISFISTQKKKSPHTLRHTYATSLLNNGADINAVKELLGHASLSATQIYTHNTFEKLNRIYKQAHPRAKK